MPALTRNDVLVNKFLSKYIRKKLYSLSKTYTNSLNKHNDFSQRELLIFNGDMERLIDRMQTRIDENKKEAANRNGIVFRDEK